MSNGNYLGNRTKNKIFKIYVTTKRFKEYKQAGNANEEGSPIQAFLHKETNIPVGTQNIL